MNVLLNKDKSNKYPALRSNRDGYSEYSVFVRPESDKIRHPVAYLASGGAARAVCASKPANAPDVA